MSNYQINYCKDKSDPTIKWHAMMIYGRFHIVVLIGSLSYMSISTFTGEKTLCASLIHCIMLAPHEKMKQRNSGNERFHSCNVSTPMSFSIFQCKRAANLPNH